MLRKIFICLNFEDELYLSYLFGKKIHDIPHLKEGNIKFQGALWRLVALLKRLGKQMILFEPRMQTCDFLFYAGTDNQFNALISTFESLSKKHRCVFIIDKGVKSSSANIMKNSYRARWSLATLSRAFLVTFCRLGFLLKETKGSESIVRKKFLDKLCLPHIYLVYFYKILRKTQPRCVVLSNDHSPSNRSLRLLCQVEGVTSCYMQHASVSSLFPPLRFNICLLDGQFSKEIYEDCEKNPSPRLQEGFKREIFLTGQKKNVASKDGRNPRYVAIAVNRLDEFGELKEISTNLVTKDIPVRIRTHPFQSAEFISNIIEMCDKNKLVSFSNPRDEALKDYFSGAYYLISGNSSIHLEAAIAGVMTYYYEFSSKVDKPDYYGYVKKGLSLSLDKEFFYSSSHESLLDLKIPPDGREEAIRHYSSTYGTDDFGREAELCEKILTRVIN